MSVSPSDTRLAVAIVSYATADLVAAALPALLGELDGLAAAAVLVVDNASPGADADRLAAHLARIGDDRVRLIRSARNGGFAAGNNLAFAAARDLGWRPDAVFLLNPDAAPRPGAVRALLEVLFSAPRIGAAGARLEREDGTGLSAAFNFPGAMIEFARGAGIGALQRRWPSMIPDPAGPVRVDWVTGAAVMLRWELVETVGGMDEGYFLYFEEVDYMRAATRAGWEIWHAPQARVLHHAGGATGLVAGVPRAGAMPDYWFTSWRRYFEKNHGRGYARLAAAAKLAGIGLGGIKRRLLGRPDRLAPGFAAGFARRCLIGAARPR